MPALRALRREWKITAISTASLSIAMALGVIGLSVSNTVLLLPPAAPEPGRLVSIYSRAADSEVDEISHPDYRDYRANNHVFADIAAAPNSISILDDLEFEGREIKLVARPVSDNYFSVLGLRPHLGRFFSPGDARGADHVAVMTYACWKRLGSDPNIVGKVLAGNAIVGVTPKSFTGSFYGVNGDLFLLMSQADTNTAWMEDRGARRLVLLARLKPGVSIRQARAEMATLAAQLRAAYPKEEKDHTLAVTRASLLPPDAVAAAEWMSALLMALVLLVLLIACANVANLLLAAAVGRRQEAAIKLALGAPRGRLIRDFLKESSLLSAAGGLVGFGIAAGLIARYSDWRFSLPMFGSFSLGLNLRLDATVAALTLLLVVIATLATGVAPALYASSPALAQILGGEVVAGGKGKNVRRNLLTIFQVAISTLVLVGMGLCQRNLYNLRHVDLGFSGRNLVGEQMYLEAEGYTEPRGKAFYDAVRQTLSAVPGVESVSLAWDLPLFGANEMPVALPERATTMPVASTVVDPAYFSTLGIRMLAGRNFGPGDRDTSPRVAVINRKMADLFWPGQDPIGKTILAGDPARRAEVIGMTAVGKYGDLDEAPRPFVYFALSQNYRGGVYAIARTHGDPQLWVQPIAQALRGLGLKIMIQPVTFRDWLDLSLLGQRIAAACVAVLSGLGLLLAVIGLFGAVSYSVRERKKELGIRVALGAAPGRLLGMILWQTLTVTGVGVAIGTALGVGATLAFRSQFYGVRAMEWTVLVPVAAAMLAVCSVVAYCSARRWVAVDPMEAIRHA
jgi:macrolide transport system ATP-binding/permease protein